MKQLLTLCFVLLGISVFFVAEQTSAKRKTFQRKATEERQIDRDAPPEARSLSSPENPSVHHTTWPGVWNLQVGWNFNGCATQNWTSHDLTEQVSYFWHVDDFASLGCSPPVPIAGFQSLWCGACPPECPPCDTPLKELLYSYATLPGYGNNWLQCWESTEFDRMGDVEVSYLIQYDTEPSYDIVYLQYQDTAGVWQTRATYDGISGPSLESLIIPGSSLPPGKVKLRFRFESDIGYSDEDSLHNSVGAVIIDSLSVAHETGLLDFQDFEAETWGATSTLDGDWAAGNCCSPFGDFAGLFPCLAPYQYLPPENMICIGCLWGFFQGSEDYYTCSYDPNGPSTPPDPVPLYPPQKVVPYGPTPCGQYIRNEIWSPWIDLGSGPFTPFNPTQLRFHVYRDLPVDPLVFYYWKVRGAVVEPPDGCPGPWKTDLFLHCGQYSVPDWYLHKINLTKYIKYKTYIQIALGVVDMYPYFSSYGYGSGLCHTDAPLFDNMEIWRLTCHEWEVYDADLFQDNFAADGTVTGTVPVNIAHGGDSAFVSVLDLEYGIDFLTPGDSSSGPAVFCHVKTIPGKEGAEISGGPNWPYIASMSTPDWTVIQMDSSMAEDYYCVDLNDTLYTPGDTIWFYFSARDKNGITSYWSQFTDMVMLEIDVRAHPMEMTCLPANGLNGVTDILYVDNCNRSGAEWYFTSTFEMLDIQPDRFDARRSSYSLGEQVVDTQDQLIPYYRTILWSSGEFEYLTLQDGDYTVLHDFLEDHTEDYCGLYISGNLVARAWAYSSAPDAVNLKLTYLPFDLLEDDHRSVGEPASPIAVGQPGSIFDHITNGPDTLIVFGGNSSYWKRFNVLEPMGDSRTEMAYSNEPSHAAVISKVTSIGDREAKVVLSGFSFDHIRDDVISGIPDRVDHLKDIIRYLTNIIYDPTAIEDEPRFINNLSQNYPNPFNPTTTIPYSIAERGHVSLKIYNISGQLVRTLVNEKQIPSTGGYSVIWDGKNSAGTPVASGVYFYRLVTKNFSKTKKLVLLK